MRLRRAMSPNQFCQQTDIRASAESRCSSAFRLRRRERAKFLNRGIQSLFEINKGVFGPEAFAESVASDEFFRMFEKNGENLDGLGLELKSDAVAEKFGGVKINFKWPEANFLLLYCGHDIPQAVRSIALKSIEWL